MCAFAPNSGVKVNVPVTALGSRFELSSSEVAARTT